MNEAEVVSSSPTSILEDKSRFQWWYDLFYEVAAAEKVMYTRSGPQGPQGHQGQQEQQGQSRVDAGNA
jgi:hypothetical protein